MKPLIVLNPGHEIGDDRGFLGPETEGSNNRKSIAITKKHLEDNYECDIKVVEQPTTPFEKLGSTYPEATLFYSRHSNAFRGIGRGTEAFYTYGKTLAANISRVTAVLLETWTRGTMGGAKRNSEAMSGHGYAVLNQAKKAGVKYALMAEIGFHDHVLENRLMVERREQIAIAEAEEIATYLKLERKPERVTAPEGKLYRVAVDSFKYRDNAEDLQRRLKADGHNAFLVVIDDPRR